VGFQGFRGGDFEGPETAGKWLKYGVSAELVPILVPKMMR
jgi:hypothetical protein